MRGNSLGHAESFSLFPCAEAYHFTLLSDLAEVVVHDSKGLPFEELFLGHCPAPAYPDFRATVVPQLDSRLVGWSVGRAGDLERY